MNTLARNILLLLSLIAANFNLAQEYRLTNPPINIVVLGSSTAAGYGVSKPDSAWVNQYDTYLKTFHPENEAVNLARGGYNTYHIMPDDFDPPNRRRRSDTTKNISRAIDLNCDGIIVNLPSNDVSNGYSTKEQLDNFRLIVKLAKENEIPIWICTVQPRNFDRHKQREQQAAINDSIIAIFSSNYIDFWTDFATESHGVVSNFDSGDGCHLNDAGHRLLTDRVIESRAFDSLLICSGERESVRPDTPMESATRTLKFSGTITSADALPKDTTTLKIIQKGSVVASISFTSNNYSITTPIPTNREFSLQFSSKNTITQSIDFNILEHHFIKMENIFKLIEIDGITLTMQQKSLLNELPAGNEFTTSRCGLKKVDDKYQLVHDEDFQRIQDEKLEYYKQPIKKGIVKRYTVDGELLSKLKYKNGKLQGKSIWYYPNGQKLVKARFKSGEYDGKCLKYTKSGEKSQKIIYENGVILSEEDLQE